MLLACCLGSSRLDDSARLPVDSIICLRRDRGGIRDSRAGRAPGAVQDVRCDSQAAS